MSEALRPEWDDHRWGVILAGGDGVRLKPLTRLACGDNRPKQFCPLLGGKTLLAHTQGRISGVIASNRTLFALTRTHERFYANALGQLPSTRKVVQPENRGTLPAIVWSLLRVIQLDPLAVVAFLPSDHYFANEAGFRSALGSAFAHAEARFGSIVLLGAAANRPETEYGWIEPEASGKLGSDGSRVKRFWEKPSHEVAEQLLGRSCLWNTFVMVGAAEAFLTLVRRASPEICETMEQLICDADEGAEQERMQELYAHLAPSDFSREVLSASTDALSVVSCGDIGWSDLGDPQRFIAALSAEGVEIPCSFAGFCNECSARPEVVARRATGYPAQFVHGAPALSKVQSEGCLP